MYFFDINVQVQPGKQYIRSRVIPLLQGSICLWSLTMQNSEIFACVLLQISPTHHPNNEMEGTPRTAYVNIYLTTHTCLPKGS
jgi:hypothetical protein